MSTAAVSFRLSALSGVAVIALALVACDTHVIATRPAPPPPPPPGPGPALYCESPDFMCVGSNTLSWCEAGRERVSDCDSICVLAGFDVSLGCGFDGTLVGDSCFCGFAMCDARDTPVCGPSGYDISYCDGGVWVDDDCDMVCADAGFSHSVGCGFDSGTRVDSCYCAAPEPVCPFGTSSCGDGTCVESAYFCDGIVDCFNGYDELFCGY